WNAQTGQEILLIKGHNGEVQSVAFSPDGTRLASAGSGTVKVWDATTSPEALTLRGFTGRVRSVAFSTDGKRLAIGTGILDAAQRDYVAGQVKVRDAQTGQDLLSLQGHTSSVNSVAFSPDGTRLASAATDRTVKVWDVQTGRELLTFKGHTTAVVSVAFSPDSTRLASCSSNPYGGPSGPGEPGEGKGWDARTGPGLLTLQRHKQVGKRVAFSHDGKSLATLSRDQTVKVWDAQTGQEIRTLKVLVAIGGSVAFSPDGKRLASSNNQPGTSVQDRPDYSGQVMMWDVQTGEE